MIATVLIWIGIVIAVLITALFVLPINITARGSIDDGEGIDYQLKISWAFGLLSAKAVTGVPAGIYIVGWRIGIVPFKNGKRKKSPKKPKKEKPSSLKWLRWTRMNMNQIRRILSRFMHASFLRGSLIGKIGLTDPADTGFIGLLCRLIHIHKKRLHISMTTVYEYEMVRIKAKIQATLILGYLGIIALGLLVDKQIRGMMRGLPQKTLIKENA